MDLNLGNLLEAVVAGAVGLILFLKLRVRVLEGDIAVKTEEVEDEKIVDQVKSLSDGVLNDSLAKGPLGANTKPKP